MGDAALDLSAKPSSFRTPPKNVSPGPINFAFNTSNCESGRSSTSSIHSSMNDLDADISNEDAKRQSPVERSNQSTADISGDEKSNSEKINAATTSNRPFKMYPMDPFYAYSGVGSTPTSPLSPMAGSFGMPNMFESPASYPGFPLTPLTSHLMQRKRRAENRIECLNDKKTKIVPEDKKDEAYWERRRKNNEAAKRSRDTRRSKEEEIAMRAAYLEQENLKLRAQVTILKNETAKLHYMLYNRI